MQACNLLPVLAKLSWTEPINWNLHMKTTGEEHIPFHLYVQDPVQTPSLGQPSSFTCFGNLPDELQLRILTFCPPPTLFRAMSGSSKLRIEASKLFWAQPNVYYLLKDYFLLRGGDPDFKVHDSSFLASVQRVEVEFTRFLLPHLRGVSMDDRRKIAGAFWKTVKKRVPNVKSVVINQADYRTRDFLHLELQALLETCPPTIDASALVYEENPSCVVTPFLNTSSCPTAWRRSLYQFTAGCEDSKLASFLSRKTIMTPISGTVNEIMRARLVYDRSLLQHSALWPLLIEVVERHHFGGEEVKPFSCPGDACHSLFDKAGQWTIHAAETHIPNELDDGLIDILPDDLRLIFEEHKRTLEEARFQLTQEIARLYREEKTKEDKAKYNFESDEEGEVAN